MPTASISRFFQPRSQNEKDRSDSSSNAKKRPRIHNAKKREEVVVMDSEVTFEPQEVILIDDDDDDDDDDDNANDAPSMLGNRNDTVVGKGQVVMNKAAALAPCSTVLQLQQGSSMDTTSIDSGQDEAKTSLTLGATGTTDENIFPESEKNQQEKLKENKSSIDEITFVPDTERNQQEQLKEIESSEVPHPLASSSSVAATTNTNPASNPFAMFGASSSTSTSSKLASLSNASSLQNFQWITHQPPNKKVAKSSLNSSTTHSTTKPPKSKAKTKAKTEWIKMRDLPAPEQARVVEKWHSLLEVLIDQDTIPFSETVVDVKDDSSSVDGTTGPTTSPTKHAPTTTLATSTPCMEDRRFQLVVAARLHAQCQENAVRKALQAVQLVCQGHLSVDQIAAANPEDLAAAMTNLQYYNAKAKHLVQSAQEIQSQFGGEVPENETQLRKLIGIGPVMGNLLAFVNTRAMHLSRTAPASALDESTVTSKIDQGGGNS